MKELLVVLFVAANMAMSGCDRSLGKSEVLLVDQNMKDVLQKDSSHHNIYSWLGSYEMKNMLLNRLATPTGYERTEVKKGTFADWLRHLPLKPGNPQVRLYNGSLKYNQSAQYAVIDIDTGNEDLQQCADAVMRLKSEYHYSKNEAGNIHFNYTSGDKAEYSKWVEGYRPVVKGNKVSWLKSGKRDTSYKGFRAYLRQVFMYAGSSSLSQELVSVPLEQMQPGDVFIRGGFPGHAVIVVDMVVNKVTGKKMFMIAQSYMPAQDIHILKNPASANSPWYPLEVEEALETPEWTFQRTDLKRFK